MKKMIVLLSILMLAMSAPAFAEDKHTPITRAKAAASGKDKVEKAKAAPAVKRVVKPKASRVKKMRRNNASFGITK